MPRAATVIMCEWWRWMPRIKNKHESHFPVCWHSTISHHRQRNLTIGRLKIIYPTAKCVGSFVVYAPVIFVAWAFFPIYVAAVDAARQSFMDFIYRLVAPAHLHSFHPRCHKYLCDVQNWHSDLTVFAIQNISLFQQRHPPPPSEQKCMTPCRTLRVFLCVVAMLLQTPRWRHIRYVSSCLRFWFFFLCVVRFVVVVVGSIVLSVGISPVSCVKAALRHKKQTYSQHTYI